LIGQKTSTDMPPHGHSMKGRAARVWPGCCLLILWALAVAPAMAQHRPAPVQLPVEGTVTGLKSAAAVRFDSDRSLSPRMLLLSDEGFEPFSPQLDALAPPLWLKLRLSIPADSTGDYVLRASRRPFVRYEVHVPGPDGSIRQARPDGVVQAQAASREVAVGFRGEPGSIVTLLVFVETRRGSLAPLELGIQDARSHQASRNARATLMGLVLGLLLTVVFYNAMIYWRLRQRVYLHFMAAMTSLVLLVAIDVGLMQARFLPSWLLAQVSRVSLLLEVALVVTMGLFFLAFVSPRRQPRSVSWTLRAGLMMLGVFLALLLVVPGDQLLAVTTMLQPTQLIIQALFLVGAFIVGRRGGRAGDLFLIAWGLFMIAWLSPALLPPGLVFRMWWVDQLPYLGTAALAVLLGAGLHARARHFYLRRAGTLEQQHEAARLANLDPLTGAYNRRFLDAYLEALAQADRNRLLDALIIDVDRFESINESHGHGFGDQVLREVVRRCRRQLDEGDVICRLGGDEFLVVSAGDADDDGLQLARRLVQAVADSPVSGPGGEVGVTVSVGVVHDVRPERPVSDLLRMTDQALYEAKQEGRNRAVLYNPREFEPVGSGALRRSGRPRR
jgi:diguanylate cyclase (GGDEF)-like protein